jgi:hypothetical protein
MRHGSTAYGLDLRFRNFLEHFFGLLLVARVLIRVCKKKSVTPLFLRKGSNHQQRATYAISSLISGTPS